MAKTTLSRTVFIGLGGTGADAIVRTKSMMLDNFGEVPPMIKFLVIDTDSITKVSYRNKYGKIITLNDDEFFHFRVPDVNAFVKTNKKETSFFPASMTRKSSSITEGAGQFRNCGRLSLIANDNKKFRNTLSNSIEAVKDWTGVRHGKYQTDTLAKTKVFIVFSIAGGSGAGLFIDFTLLLKGDPTIGGGVGIETAAIALLPDVYASLGESAANCRPNALTGITEYELIADGKLAEIESDPNHPSRKILSHGGDYLADPNNLYDTFFMVNNESSNGVKYEKANEMADLISKSLFLAAGATGGIANSALDNIRKAKIGKNLRGRMLRYLGLGCAEMVFDASQVASYYSLIQANSICNNVLNKSAEIKSINDEVQVCFDEWKIQEDQKRDDVINFIADKNPKQGFTGINEFDESSATAIKSRRESFINGLKDSLSKSIFDSQGTLDQITGSGLNNLQSFVSEKINSWGGLHYLKELLPNMIGRFKGMMDEMTEEKKKFADQLEKFENSYLTKLSEIEDAANISRFKVFVNRKNRIEAACDEYINVVNSEATCIHEIERRTAAMSFYRKMIERSEKILNSVISFEDRLRKVVESTSMQIQKIKNRSPKEPFSIDVTPEYIRSMTLTSDDVDMGVFLERIKISEITLRDQMDESELFDIVTSYTNSLSKTIGYLQTTLLDALETMTKDKDLEKRKQVEELFLQLKSTIGILRMTNPNYKIDNAINYVVGVFDVDHPAIKDKSKELDEKDGGVGSVKIKLDFDGGKDGSGSKKAEIAETVGDIMRKHFKIDGRVLELSNTKDPNKIIVSAYESAVPAFVVKNFEGYQYDLKLKTSSTELDHLYSNKHWYDIISKRNYTIFPKDDDNAIMAWALAFFVSKVEKDKHGKAAQQFIVKPKNGKYAVFTTSGDKPMKDLHAYRPKAYEMFTEQQQLVDQILPMLQQKIKNDLSTYRAKLEELKNDHQGNIYIDEYSNHNLGKTTYNSEAHENTRTLVMDEFRFLKSIGDISDLIS